MGTAEEERDKAMRRAENGADPAWNERAFITLVEVACLCRRFTTDVMWQVLDSPREPRAMGPVISKGIREQIIRFADEPPRNSDRPETHANPKRVYVSLVFGLDADDLLEDLL